MNWTELLTHEIDDTYRATEKLLDFVDEDALDWKPQTGANWMTTGQLLFHLTESCGMLCRGFVTGEWPVPVGVDPEKDLPETTVPAEAMRSAASLDETRRLLEEDKQLALRMLAQAGEEALATRPTAAPWDPRDKLLGHRLLEMVQHLFQHKGQLFYYLKLQGKPVDTGHLWGL
jgi:uncharacterized damage-inducible protein DinB